MTNSCSKSYAAPLMRTFHLMICGRLGFEKRIRGSHHIFRKQGVEEKMNLQRDDNKAKAYQVRQVRAIILRYRLGGAG